GVVGAVDLKRTDDVLVGEIISLLVILGQIRGEERLLLLRIPADALDRDALKPAVGSVKVHVLADEDAADVVNVHARVLTFGGVGGAGIVVGRGTVDDLIGDVNHVEAAPGVRARALEVHRAFEVDAVPSLRTPLADRRDENVLAVAPVKNRYQRRTVAAILAFG